jgi:EAL domain-containing protein (putative c-di-GMP-specific phosphodiesterase class I)
METGNAEPRGWPLHWRVRATLWGVGAAAAGGVALAGEWRLAAQLAAGLALLLLVAGEATVRAVRRAGAPRAEPAAVTGPTEPAPAPGAGLARALAEGELVVLYRPLRTLPELSLCGVESELRWRRPMEGLQAPDQWPQPLPPALADALLAAWLPQACAQFADWQRRLDQRAPGMLWLRLPAPLLEAPGLEALLAQALQASGVARSRLRLRVTPALAGRTAVLPEAARRLQQQGLALAVDGFGVGTASLAQLNQLPVAAVCLDHTLVERAAQHLPQRLVVESTARLAASLGMVTLADGITSEAQVLALGTLGCQLGVGEVCGPWLEAELWSQRWALPKVTDDTA